LTVGTGGTHETKTTYREAMREALREALSADDRVFLMGEDVGRYGGCFGVSLGLLEEFGPERVRDTPLWAPASARHWPGCGPSSRS
jgi:pyruvate dehydrogenase E1 component beta subunit